MKYRTATCLLLCTTAVTGCGSTSRFVSSNSNTPIPVNKIEQTEVASKPPVSLASTSPQSIEERIQAGQTQISHWYENKQQRHLSAAKTHFESVLVQNPKHAKAHHGLAIIADLEKNYSAAESHYQQALAQNPSDSNILGDLSYSYLLQDRLAESERLAHMALQVNPQNRNAIRHLGDAYARQGKTNQAQEIYSRILSDAEVQSALAENAPRNSASANNPAVAQSTSLIDRLIPGRTTGEKLTEDILKKQQQFREEQTRRASAQATLNRPGFPPQNERLSREALLRQQLAEIDRETTPRSIQSTGPILIDNQTRELTRLPGGDATGAWSQGANLPMSTMMPLQEAPSYGSAVEQNHADYSSSSNLSHSQGTRSYHDETEQQMVAREMAATHPPGLQPWKGLTGDSREGQNTIAETPNNHQDFGYQNSVNHAYQQGANSPGTTNQVIPTVAQDQRPMTPRYQGEPQSSRGNGFAQNFGNGAPTNANGMMNSFPQNGQNPQGNQPAFAQNGSQDGHQSGQGMAAHQQGQPNPNQANSGFANPGQTNSLQAASRTAARMGMGLAPASYSPQATPVYPPGAMSYEEMGVPAPQRVMPDQRPVQNLNQAYDPFTTQNSPPPVFQGSPSLPVNAPMYTRDQYNSPIRFDEQTLQNSGVPLSRWDAMKPYEAQRWEAGKQMNHAVQEVWAQGPVNSPLSPSAGSQYSYPSSSGPTFTPNPPPDAKGVRPPEWPYAQPAVPSSSVIAAERANPRAPGVELPQYLEQQKQQARQQQMANGGQTPQQTFYGQNPQQIQQPPQYQNAQYQNPQQQRQSQQYDNNITIPPSYRPSGSVNANSPDSSSAQQATPQQSRPTQGGYGTYGSYGDDQSMPMIRPR